MRLGGNQPLRIRSKRVTFNNTYTVQLNTQKEDDSGMWLQTQGMHASQ